MDSLYQIAMFPKCAQMARLLQRQCGIISISVRQIAQKLTSRFAYLKCKKWKGRGTNRYKKTEIKPQQP